MDVKWLGVGVRCWRGWGSAGEHDEGGFGVDPAGVGPGAQDGGGDDGANAELGEQAGPPGADVGQDVFFVAGGLAAEGEGAPSSS
jgi:hypothetical protein